MALAAYDVVARPKHALYNVYCYYIVIFLKYTQHCLYAFVNLSTYKPTRHQAMNQFPQQSVRSDDGGARHSVHALIAELEGGMRRRGGNYMNITGMNLAVVRTLLNHINKLEDRIDELEGVLGRAPRRNEH
jgi:hypothetical protein